MALSLENRTEENAEFVTLTGDLDVESSPILKEELNRLMEAGARHIVMDMSGVAYMDSSGLGALVAAHRALTPRGSLSLLGCRPAVERVLRFTQFDKLLPLYRTLEDYQSGNRDNLRAVSGVSKSVIEKQKAVQRATSRRPPPRTGGRRLD